RLGIGESPFAVIGAVLSLTGLLLAACRLPLAVDRLLLAPCCLPFAPCRLLLALGQAGFGLLARGLEGLSLLVELALAHGDRLQLLRPLCGRRRVVVAGGLEVAATPVDVLRQACKPDLFGGDRRSGLGELGPLALHLLESSPELRVALAELLFGCRDAI